MDLDALPLPAKHIVLQHLGTCDWRTLREVSKCWLVAVDLEVTSLGPGGGAARMPLQTLPTRFPGMASLDLSFWGHDEQGNTATQNFQSQDKLAGLLLGLANLRRISNLADVGVVAAIRRLWSWEDLEQRASLASRLTRLSLSPATKIISGASQQQLADLAKEWCHIQALTLKTWPSNRCLPAVISMAPALNFLELHNCPLLEAVEILKAMASSEVCAIKELKVTTNHSPGTTILTGEQVTSSQAEIYSSVGQFQLIERLHLERCGTDIGPLNQLKKLTCMSLPEAQLTSQDLTRLSGLTDMTSLDVRGSHLTAPFAIRSALRPFQNLRHLDVSGSSQLRADMALGQLTSLTSLYARHCPQLGSLAPLSTLTQLLALNLASSDFGTLGDISGLAQLTALDISVHQSIGYVHQPIQNNKEWACLGKLTSLRHLNISGQSLIPACSEAALVGPEQLPPDLLGHLSGLTSVAFLNMAPAAPLGTSIQPLFAWEVLEPLQHLPLQELHVGVSVKWPLCPSWLSARALHRAVQEALEGAPDRLRLAMLRGTRGWPSQEEAGRLLCPARDRQ